MSSYIGVVQIGENGDQVLIGSTLFGECTTQANQPAKTVTLSSFDQLLSGVTVQVKFTNGNTARNNLTLQVGSTAALAITGSCLCDANQVIAFTYENVSGTGYWRAHHNIKGAMPITGGTFTGAVTLNGAPTADLEAATKGYVDSKVAGFDGLTGAMHFIGISSTIITNGGTQNPTIEGSSNTSREKGDVVLYLEQEYVWNGNAWQLLGDEGSYVLKTSQTTASVGSASGWNAGSVPTLGTAIDADDITNWDAGSASNAVVSNGVLRLTNSVAPTLAYTARTVPNVTDVGSVPTLTVTPATVVTPTATP